jgi:hypothetical protein
MADTTPYPLFNGNAFSWASAEFNVLGVPRLGLTAVNWNLNIDPADVRGAGPNIIAYTQGNVTLDGDFEMLLHQFNDMVKDLGPGWLGQTIGDIVAKFSEDTSGFDPVIETLRGVRITQIGATSQASSSDALVRKCTFKYLQHLIGDVNPFPIQQTSTQ